MTRPACAVHAERESVLVCVRCGSFACAECSPPPSALCRACVAREAHAPQRSEETWWKIGRASQDPRLPAYVSTGALAIATVLAAVGGDWAPAALFASIGAGAWWMLQPRAWRKVLDEIDAAGRAAGAGRHEEAAAALESIARRAAVHDSARFGCLLLLQQTLTRWGLHDRAIVIARELAGAHGFPRVWTAAAHTAVQILAVCLGDVREARAARGRAKDLGGTELALPIAYGDLAHAAREERWMDVLLAADAIEHDHARLLTPELTAWIGIFRAFALERSRADPSAIDAALAPARSQPGPYGQTIPAWPDLREFVESRLDRGR